jgi:thiol-disulfide isomerase/thioredoxin
LLFAGVVVCGVGCVGQPDPYTGGGGDPNSHDASAQPDPRDGAPGTADAAPRPPDATPQLYYPSGPYGNDEGDVIANLGWMGYIDSNADSDDDPFNEAEGMIMLEDFFVGNDPTAKVIMINSSAGWCGSCQTEAAALPGLRDQYYASGARFVTAMFEDASGSPSSVGYAKSWGEFFDLNFPTVADPQDLLGAYYQENAVPMNMFVDAETMTIIDIHHGYDGSYARQVLDAYTN